MDIYRYRYICHGRHSSLHATDFSPLGDVRCYRKWPKSHNEFHICPIQIPSTGTFRSIKGLKTTEFHNKSWTDQHNVYYSKLLLVVLAGKFNQVPFEGWVMPEVMLSLQIFLFLLRWIKPEHTSRGKHTVNHRRKHLGVKTTFIL